MVEKNPLLKSMGNNDSNLQKDFSLGNKKSSYKSKRLV